MFRAAFEFSDPLALEVLRSTANALAEQVIMLLRPEAPLDEKEAQTIPKLAVKASEAVVCFGGSLVGVEQYQRMVLNELEKKGHVFKHTEFVGDASIAGAKALALQLAARQL